MRTETSPMVRMVAGGLAVAMLAIFVAATPEAWAQRERRERSTGSAEGEFQARMLLRRATDLMTAGEDERSIKMLETIIQQYPSSNVRFFAYLELGKHYVDEYEQVQAIEYLRNLKEIESEYRDQEIPRDLLEVYLEGMYHTGVAYFQMRQFGSAFPILRKITSDHPNTVWANQAYYYIGMCHFAQGNWNKAIEALSVVGTFVDPKSPTVQYVEAGRRFYVKVEDTDLPVLHRLGKDVILELATTSGDKERVECIPLSGNAELFVGSIPTKLGAAEPNDGTLQVIGGDSIATSYVDENTKEGQKDVKRLAEVEVVSTAVANFTLGDYSTVTKAAFLGQPLFASLHDADLDTTDSADLVEVRIISRYQEEEEEDPNATATQRIDLDRLFASEEDNWVTRDEVVVKLQELGEGSPIRTGDFGARVELAAHREGQPADKSNQILTVALEDEVVMSYVDDVHINGRSPRDVTATVKVADEISSKPQVQQLVVNDPVVAAKKNVIEATALLELARIFKSMGLTKGAAEKADEGLDRVEANIRTRAPIPTELTEKSFKLKWELFLAKNDLPAAIRTCQLFSKLFPDSPFVDQALMGIAEIKMEEGDIDEAIGIYEQILRLPNSGAKAEALFKMAEAMEANTERNRYFAEKAIETYKRCAEQFPDSEFAGASLAKLVDYYISTKDYAQANDLLEQVFQDYPDAAFLDSMLLKWVMVAYRMGDFQKAYDKCAELVFEYPTSRFAEKAKDILDKLKQRVQQ